MISATVAARKERRTWLARSDSCMERAPARELSDDDLASEGLSSGGRVCGSEEMSQE
jgi:hypothetical protein